MTTPEDQGAHLRVDAEHTHDVINGTDEMYRDGCRVVLTSDEAGIPLVKVSLEPMKSVVIWYHDDIIFSDVPDQETHQAMLDAAEEAKKSAPLKDQVMEAVTTRMVNGDATDPAIMAVEEADRILTAQGVSLPTVDTEGG